MKDKGYVPELDHAPEVRRGEQDDDFGPSRVTTKAPRPEPEKTKKLGKLKSTLRPGKIPKPWLKDPEIMRMYNIRRMLIIIGILVLIFSILGSLQNYLFLIYRETSLEENGYNLLLDLQEYPELKLDDDTGLEVWDANKFLKLTSDELKNDLKTDFQFIIEVFDLSSYPIKYNRTVENDLAWSTGKLPESTGEIGDNKFEISSYINIFVSSDEVHLARIDILVWK